MQNIIEIMERPDEACKGTIFRLYEAIFDTPVSDEMRSRIASKPDLYLLLVEENGESIGFKIGYREDHETFYSWLGGVLPTFRGQGLGKLMILRQHDYCQKAGYRLIRTKTLNRWKSMLLLNIQMGFDIVGLEVSRQGHAKIVLEKKLF